MPKLESRARRWATEIGLAVAFACGPFLFAQVKVLTVAGGYGGDSKPATKAGLQFPQYAARDSAGNVYISDYLNHRIRKVDTSGTITTLAGNGLAGFSGDGGPAKSAKLDFPKGVAVDATGNVIFADSGNNRIRKVSTSGIITTIAGTGVAGFGGDGGPATAALIDQPNGVAVDQSGDVLIADLNNQRIRKIDTAGVITTVAGNGITGFSGDGGPAISASLNNSYTVLPGAANDFYIADTDNFRVRRVDSAGTISTFAGSVSYGCTGDGGPATAAGIGRPKGLAINAGRLMIAAGCDFIREVDLTSNIISTAAGSNTSLGSGGFDGNGHSALSSVFFVPTGLSSDLAGNLLIVDAGNSQVRKLDSTTQIVTAFAGGYIGDGGAGTTATLNSPYGIAIDSSKNIFIADMYNNRVRVLSAAGTITTFAGTGVTGSSGDGGPAVSATLSFPTATATDQNGNVFIADTAGLVVRKVDASGIITTLVSENSDFFLISALATDGQGNVYAADAGACVIWKITSTGTYSVAAGVPNACAYNSDGIPATSAWLNAPWGIWVRNGNLYIGDGLNNRVRKVNTSGIISTIAGNGSCGFSGDGGLATAAKLCNPNGLAFDSKSNLYIADYGNLRVRKITSGGIISTIAGTGKAGFNGNGLPATNTNFDGPISVAADATGVVYVDDLLQNRVRSVH